jgi:hypothetical protein
MLREQRMIYVQSRLREDMQETQTGSMLNLAAKVHNRGDKWLRSARQKLGESSLTHTVSIRPEVTVNNG